MWIDMVSRIFFNFLLFCHLEEVGVDFLGHRKVGNSFFFLKIFFGLNNSEQCLGYFENPQYLKANENVDNQT